MFSIFKKFKDGLKKTAQGALGGILDLFSKKISESDIDFIEETLYGADFGWDTTSDITEAIRNAYKREKELRGKDAAQIGSDVLSRILEGSEGELKIAQNAPTVICLVGVNGSGKTTTAAKLASLIKKSGKSVVLGACDTFRAAANEQIKTWAERLDVDLVASSHGADSAAVAWDAFQAAKSRGADFLILDTAGRLHNKENLMNELAKIRRVLEKNDPTAPQNSIIVVDGSLGSNSIEQAKAFDKAFKLSAMIITKLDGTSKGGALAGIYRQLKLPILYVGLGERAEDLQKFDVKAYCNSIFGLDEN
ncbi:signal recognition particle-docking protein FtsY [Intestinicryptomonas porci]|uniref:Signal recognition particle receptor FtsY n=1 Tax=Intestinicryptomonas porci TaxID=2926320 RepID=A0ABU4WE68_9BACT|nr:signal recognition particle-docking protein FtsY [Opitutales bacterium CLA-KB-P66]